MYQDDHAQPSGPCPDNGPDVSPHSLPKPHIIDEVDLGELHASHSNQHEAILSSESESELHMNLTISIVIYSLKI